MSLSRAGSYGYRIDSVAWQRIKPIEPRLFMKTFVRVLVLSLAVTGAFASSHHLSADLALHSKVSAMPVPICPPGDPNGCGICQFNGCPPDPK
jgi:hypothetical protein